jgi:RHS repeat-associated protein
MGPGVDEPLVWYQGSIVGTGNSSGALAVNYTYDAHGAPNTWGTVGTVPRFRYTGQAAIPEAKLYHYKARVHDPVSGRFLQTDPVGYGPDVNWYAYVGDDPVNGSDPSGMNKPLDVGGDEFGFFGIEGDNATQGDLAGDMGLNPVPPSSSKPSPVVDNTSNSTSKPSSQPGSGYSNLSPDRSLEKQKADFANPKLNGIPEAERQEAIGMAAVPAAGTAVGGAIAAAPEMAAAAGRAILKGCGCFVAGTLVDTPVGLRPIEEIRVGDLVISRASFGGAMANKTVTALIRPHNRAVYEVKIEQSGRGTSETFGVTDDHPWMSKDGRWLTTLQLHADDQLQTEDGARARVVSVVATNRTANTFNLEVADNHTYFVGNERVWVHNACFAGFKAAQKWLSQLSKRGWTSDQIDEAVASGRSFPARNNINPANGATRLVHPKTGQSVVIDNVTGEVIHVGGPGFRY